MTAPAITTATAAPAVGPTTTRAPYFTDLGDGAFAPTESAAGYWGEGLLSGPAVVGLAASALEERFGAPEFQPARFTVDLLKPARQLPTHVQTRLIRDGRRLRHAECDVIQGDWIVARATLMQYLRSDSPGGGEWSAPATFTPPAHAAGDVVYVGSDDAGWSPMGEQHQNVSRKRAYYRGLDVVAGRPVSPFVRAAIVAEAATNLVVNLGEAGIGYINGDISVALSRLPVGEFLGVQADTHLSADGVSVGTATLFDDAGPFGTGMVTALANPAARIDFGAPAAVTAPGSELFAARGA